MLAVDLHEDFVDVEGVAVATMFTLQSAGINGAEFDTPEADRFSGNSDASLSEKIFNIAVTEIESIVKPNGIGNNVRWESVAFVSIHLPILPVTGF